MKVSACDRLSRHPLTGHWYRALNLKYWKSRLDTKHTMSRSKSRFSAATPSSPLYRILYLGENHQVAIYEVGCSPGRSKRAHLQPQGLLALDEFAGPTSITSSISAIRLSRRLISTNDQELTGVWANASGKAPTQNLGAALYALP